VDKGHFVDKIYILAGKLTLIVLVEFPNQKLDLLPLLEQVEHVGGGGRSAVQLSYFRPDEFYTGLIGSIQVFKKELLELVVSVQVILSNHLQQHLLVAGLNGNHRVLLDFDLPLAHREALRNGSDWIHQILEIHINIFTHPVFLEILQIDLAEFIILSYYFFLVLHEGLNGLDHFLVIGIQSFNLSLFFG
jgi:hypothetical protein